MANLKKCLHCGGEAGFLFEGNGAVFVRCLNPLCAIRTPAFAASIEYGAKDRVAKVWNGPEGEDGSEGRPFAFLAGMNVKKLLYYHSYGHKYSAKKDMDNCTVEPGQDDTLWQYIGPYAEVE